MILYENRASTILYNIITSINNDKYFLLPANICPIVVATFLKAKRKFEFIDISKNTLCIDEEKTISLLKTNPEKYAGILFVRTYGVEDSFEKLFLSLKEINNEIIIIDDKCLAPPSFEANIINADINLYSTGYSKFVNLGFGGFAKTKKDIEYSRKKLSYSKEDLDILNDNFRQVISNSANFNLKNIKKKWLDTSVPKIPFNEYKEMLIANYAVAEKLKKEFNYFFSKSLPPSIQFPSKFQNWRFNIKIANKKILLDKIFKAGLFASSHYVPSSKIFYNSAFKNANDLSNMVVNLFTDNCFPFEKAEQLTTIINEHVEGQV